MWPVEYFSYSVWSYPPFPLTVEQRSSIWADYTELTHFTVDAHLGPFPALCSLKQSCEKQLVLNSPCAQIHFSLDKGWEVAMCEKNKAWCFSSTFSAFGGISRNGHSVAPALATWPLPGLGSHRVIQSHHLLLLFLQPRDCGSSLGYCTSLVAFSAPVYLWRFLPTFRLPW
jgi:hypothetical protein